MEHVRPFRKYDKVWRGKYRGVVVGRLDDKSECVVISINRQRSTAKTVDLSMRKPREKRLTWWFIKRFMDLDFYSNQITSLQ